jgi:hypothetical protein
MNIEQVIGDLYKRIESPIFTSPAISVGAAGNVAVYGMSPEKLPDLFSGSELSVYGRYKGSGAASVVLTGRIRDKKDTLEFTAGFPDSATQYSFVPRLWATQQIARIMTRIKLQTMTMENLTPLIDSVKALSLAYGIVTPYTDQVFTAPGGSSWGGALQTSSGKSANDASNLMQGMQQNSNAVQTMVADTNAVPYTVAPQINQIQNAGNKAFVFAADSIWRDASFDSTKPSDTITYASDEYFTLASQSPDVIKLLSVGSQTAFNYQGQNYVVLYKGKASSSARDPGTRAATNGAKPAGFAVVCTGSTVLFTGLSGAYAGRVTVYSASGSVVATVPINPFEHCAAWSSPKESGSGAFIAVYKNNRVKEIKKFTLVR